MIDQSDELMFVNKNSQKQSRNSKQVMKVNYMKTLVSLSHCSPVRSVNLCKCVCCDLMLGVCVSALLLFPGRQESARHTAGGQRSAVTVRRVHNGGTRQSYLYL